jgi:phage shock protein A
VRREEALARGMEEVAVASIEEQFAQLDVDEDEREVEARFAQLKAGQAPRLTSGV